MASQPSHRRRRVCVRGQHGVLEPNTNSLQARNNQLGGGRVSLLQSEPPPPQDRRDCVPCILLRVFPNETPKQGRVRKPRPHSRQACLHGTEKEWRQIERCAAHIGVLGTPEQKWVLLML